MERSSDSPTTDEQEARLRTIRNGIERYWEDLFVTARVFVRRFDLASPANSAEAIAQEVLHDAVVRALELANRYDPARPVRPWLFGILLNVARETRRQRWGERTRVSTIAHAARRTGLISESAGATLTEEELLDLLRDPEDGPSLTARLDTEDLLSLVDEGDQEVLRLAVVGGRRGKLLAERLQISEGAAYTRLSRALTRLSKAYAQTGHGR